MIRFSIGCEIKNFNNELQLLREFCWVNMFLPCWLVFLIFCFSGVGQFESLAFAQEIIEGEIQVLPVFFKPTDQRLPSKAEARRLQRHVLWAQKRYRQLLNNQSTFKVADTPEVYEAKERLSFYKKSDRPALNMADELIAWKNTDRYDCKFIFLTVVMNTEDKFPGGSGSPFNGGFNTGGGLAVIGLQTLNSQPNFQSTIQHELGHTFGLNHIKVYGYDMKRNDSIMSYNPDHHTKNFTPSRNPGSLIPEDRRGLAMNDLVFPNLEFDRERDIPKGYDLGGVVTFPALKIPNRLQGIAVSTDSGEAYKSSVSNIVQGRIYPSIDRGEIEFKSKKMWHSDKLKSGWATVELEFPKLVTLDRIEIYSQHSGTAHPVVAAKVFAVTEDGQSKLQCNKKDLEPVASLAFNATESEKWKLELRAGKSKRVVVRGLRFFNGARELFPPRVPPSQENGAAD